MSIGKDATGIRLCALTDIPNGGTKCFTHGDHAILVVRLGGTCHALANACTHLAKPLDNARVVGTHIFCPFHGAQFDIGTGKALGGPAVDALAIYACHVRDGVVVVELPVA